MQDRSPKPAKSRTDEGRNSDINASQQEALDLRIRKLAKQCLDATAKVKANEGVSGKLTPSLPISLVTKLIDPKEQQNAASTNGQMNSKRKAAEDVANPAAKRLCPTVSPTFFGDRSISNDTQNRKDDEKAVDEVGTVRYALPTASDEVFLLQLQLRGREALVRSGKTQLQALDEEIKEITSKVQKTRIELAVLNREKEQGDIIKGLKLKESNTRAYVGQLEKDLADEKSATGELRHQLAFQETRAAKLTDELREVRDELAKQKAINNGTQPRTLQESAEMVAGQEAIRELAELRAGLVALGAGKSMKQATFEAGRAGAIEIGD